MPRLIGKFSKGEINYYFDYFTVDGTASPAMRLEEYREHYLRLHGPDGLAKLPQRLERANEKGTSSRRRGSLDDMIKGNRAGEDQAELSAEQLIERLLSQRELSTVVP